MTIKRKEQQVCRPITDQQTIQEFRWALRRTTKDAQADRNVMLFNFGINCGLRISDIVPLQVRDVINQDNQIRIVQQKTQKDYTLRINRTLRAYLDEYIKTSELQPDDYLFPSRQSNGKNGHITTTQAYRIIKNAADLLNIRNVGTHSLRKTFGYWHYKKFKDVAVLQKIFHHSSQSVTLRYIGVEQEEIDKTMDDFGL